MNPTEETSETKAGKKKKALLYIFMILLKETDQNHYLTYIQISDRLKEEYGIELDRKAVSDDVDILDKFFSDVLNDDYEITKSNLKGKRGVALTVRGRLDPNQIDYLIDSIYSSKSIPAGSVNDYIDFILSTQSSYKNEDIRRKFGSLEKKDASLRRIDNGEFYWNIEKINEAKEKGQAVRFVYCDYDENGELVPRRKKPYTTYPKVLVNNNDTYYVLCHNWNYGNIVPFKVNQIKNIEILEDADVIPIEESKAFAGFNLEDYLNEHIYICGGESINAKFKIKANNRQALTFVIDWFGKAKIGKDEHGDYIVDVKVNRQAFVYWAMQYIDDIEVLKPQSVRNKIAEKCKKAAEQYGSAEKDGTSAEENTAE